MRAHEIHFRWDIIVVWKKNYDKKKKVNGSAYTLILWKCIIVVIAVAVGCDGKSEKSFSADSVQACSKRLKCARRLLARGRTSRTSAAAHLNIEKSFMSTAAYIMHTAYTAARATHAHNTYNMYKYCTINYNNIFYNNNNNIICSGRCICVYIYKYVFCSWSGAVPVPAYNIIIYFYN